MIQLIITMDEENNGMVHVSGPIHNKLLCYGLLEVAKDAVREYKAPSNNIIIPELKVAAIK